MLAPMKIQFQFRGLNASASLRVWLEEQLERLHHLMPLSAAEVVLEQQRDNAPAFRAHVHLAVSGPDIHAAARDHTLEAVWLKVASKLRQQIERRKNQQQLRIKSRCQHPLTASRWSGGVAGQRA
jgi:ribosomal subunit interface protein